MRIIKKGLSESVDNPFCFLLQNMTLFDIIQLAK